jgi:hypothetical protein
MELEHCVQNAVGTHRRGGIDNVHAGECVVGLGLAIFLGGVAAGAIVGGALTAPHYYRPYPYYYYGPGYGPITGQVRGADPCGTVTPG